MRGKNKTNKQTVRAKYKEPENAAILNNISARTAKIIDKIVTGYIYGTPHPPTKEKYNKLTGNKSK